jgi:hypothetical protein
MLLPDSRRISRIIAPSIFARSTRTCLSVICLLPYAGWSDYSRTPFFDACTRLLERKIHLSLCNYRSGHLFPAHFLKKNDLKLGFSHLSLQPNFNPYSQATGSLWLGCRSLGSPSLRGSGDLKAHGVNWRAGDRPPYALRQHPHPFQVHRRPTQS